MRPAAVALSALVFASRVFAGPITDRVQVPLDQTSAVRVRHRQLERRTSPVEARASAANKDGYQASNAEAEAACMQEVTAGNVDLSNPTGITACYNLPFMDYETGVFQARLSIYNTSTPSRDWAGLTAEDMVVSLAYLGATVQMLGPQSKATRRSRRSVSLEMPAKSNERQTAAKASQEMNVLTFAGKVNSNVMGPQLNEPQIQSFLIPEIEVSARSPWTNQILEVILSSKDASFVQGVFAGGEGTPITAASAASATALANSRAPFVLPGVALGIFPVGMIVTVTWVVLIVGVVATGTYRRHQFKQQYIRRRNREIWANIRMGRVNATAEKY